MQLFRSCTSRRWSPAQKYAWPPSRRLSRCFEEALSHSADVAEDVEYNSQSLKKLESDLVRASSDLGSYEKEAKDREG